MAAPVGNSNAAKARVVRDQMKWALENYSSSKVEQGKALRIICMNLVEQACEDKNFAAIQTIFERIEGKPVQAIAGDDENPLTLIHKVALIAMTDDNSNDSAS